MVDIVRNIDAFTTNMGIPDYPVTYYNTFDTWLNVLKSALYVTITVLSDAFMASLSFRMLIDGVFDADPAVPLFHCMASKLPCRCHSFLAVLG